jgi:hypothetical protein
LLEFLFNFFSTLPLPIVPLFPKVPISAL